MLFGATGDLAKRKLLPGMAYLVQSSLAPKTLEAFSRTLHRILDFLRTSRVVPGSPCENQQIGGEPRGDEIEQHFDVGAQQGLHGRIAGQNFEALPEASHTFGQEFRHGHRRLEHEQPWIMSPKSRMPTQAVPSSSSRRLRGWQSPWIACERKPRSMPSRATNSSSTEAGAAAFVGKIFGEFMQRRCLTHVPHDPLCERDVEEAGKRSVQPGQALTDMSVRTGAGRLAASTPGSQVTSRNR